VLRAGQDMTVATVRPDGAPQATSVSYANDGLTIYFGCAEDSQKAHNLARDARVSCAITLPYDDWTEIRGVSLGGEAVRMTDGAELGRAAALFLAKFPQVTTFVSGPAPLAMFRITPNVVSLLDYRLGFGRADLVTGEALKPAGATAIAA
jgi:hypothetical protein